MRERFRVPLICRVRSEGRSSGNFWQSLYSDCTVDLEISAFSCKAGNPRISKLSVFNTHDEFASSRLPKKKRMADFVNRLDVTVLSMSIAAAVAVSFCQWSRVLSGEYCWCSVDMRTYCAARSGRSVFETEVDCLSIYLPPSLAKSKIHHNVWHLMSIN